MIGSAERPSKSKHLAWARQEQDFTVATLEKCFFVTTPDKPDFPQCRVEFYIDPSGTVCIEACLEPLFQSRGGDRAESVGI